MNENTHIQNLIDKFLTASTTEAEERELADFFASCENVPPQWEDLAIMFGGFRAEKANVSLPKKSKKIPVVRLAWMAAASVALWLGISFFMGSSDAEVEPETAVAQLNEAKEDFMKYESSEITAELEELSLEFDLMMLNEEFEKKLDEEKTIYVSL